MVGPPASGLRFFYNESSDPHKFREQNVTLKGAFDFLLRNAGEEAAAAFAIQSSQVSSNLPGLERENPVGLLSPEFEPRVEGTTGCRCRAIRPERKYRVCRGEKAVHAVPVWTIAHLHPGPIDRKPAGTSVSMVDFDDVDGAVYPGFADALEARGRRVRTVGRPCTSSLCDGPNVRSLEPVSLLVNYGWKPAAFDASPTMDTLLQAILAIRHLLKPHKQANARCSTIMLFRRWTCLGTSTEGSSRDSGCVVAGNAQSATRNDQWPRSRMISSARTARNPM